ncbi:sensor histidine kinase [uncultured Phenylobacterium sp.]|uniref:sensor histidine kinase n=1 Tax=uncultured Phenylobacterium sp. TaxID=349273 RepID=UPI0025FB944B|nr:PAS domain S-box protein [uncultured Phenylobacterium sp.]
MTALTQAPLGIAIFDREMRYLAASQQYLTDQGLPGDTPLVGRVHYDVFPAVPQKWRDGHARAIAEGVELSHEADPYEPAPGRTEWIRWRVAPWRDEAGEIGGIVLYTEVVTAQVVARQRLEAAEARYRAVFNQAATGVGRVSPQGRFLEVNDRFCAITRYSREELLDLTFQEITHPDDLEGDIAQVRRVLSGEIPTYTLEKRYLSPSGDVVWIDLTVSLVRKADGSPDYFVSIIEDIATRKQAQAEQQRYQSQQRLMINELNHRVKNTLATVQSIAAQTLRAEPEPAVAYSKFESRLIGLAEVHDVLTRENWHGAALQEVAERAMRPYAGAAGRIVLAGPQVWLAPGAALTLALVFHELATNAVKYGALGLAGGRVALGWTFEAGDARLALTWSESGGPPVALPTRRGFGSRLIERGFRGELSGQAEMRYDPGGLICAMEARLSPSPPALSLHDNAAPAGAE